ncbi:hypothetical protein EG68_11387 [Paragonimus skrjabini miyazakii]|uniref:Amidase domain-containing protein n=1 Tax=Paragonimus skrjabini miyazakii TaxID=59628 RepID=A0A8S9Y982_9TREM|nr:hypothetical protein EG68_11387 [Paragonimus skrjabini miyazakii]
MKHPVKLVYYLLDVISILYVLDYLSFCLSTEVLHTMLGFTLESHRWLLFRWVVIGYISYRIALTAWHRHTLSKRLTRKRNDLLDKHGRLNEKLKVTEKPAISTQDAGKMSLSELREQLRAKAITSVDLIDAYQRRALEIFRCRPGCVSEIVFDADVYAILADSQLESEENPKLSPLHGIPVSVQEIFPVRGYDHTMGYTCRTNKPAENDCALVAALKNAGAIPFVLTNFRQKLLGLTCDNPIFGRTVHPTHPHRACVSGDAALLLHRGTPLSFAADILGGARLSAAACGLVGFKPTSGRMSQKGLDLPIRMPATLNVIASPVAHKVSDVADALRSLWLPSALFTEDVALCPIPFDESMFTDNTGKKLTVGYYTSLDDMPASPAVKRVIFETKRLLETQGHTVVEFKPPDVSKAYQLVISLLVNVMGPGTLKLVYKEGHGDILVNYKQRGVHAVYAMPSFLRKSICYTRAAQIKSRYALTSVALRGFGCSKPFAELEYEAQEYVQTFFDAWNTQQLDCLLCPVSPLPPVWDYSAFHVVNCVLLFTSLYNLLGCPAGTVCAGRVQREDIHDAKDEVRPGRYLKQSLIIAQQLDAAEGLPINIQIVAKPWKDELVLGVMHLIENGMKTSVEQADQSP